MEAKITNLDFLGKLNPKKYEWAGIFLTLCFVGIGIYIIYKNHKKEGFWLGFIALAIMGCSISIDKQGSTSTTT